MTDKTTDSSANLAPSTGIDGQHIVSSSNHTTEVRQVVRRDGLASGALADTVLSEIGFPTIAVGI
jgi:hypothetical protein